MSDIFWEDVPEVIPRRLLEANNYGGYLESDRDYFEKNREAAIFFLDHAKDIADLVREARIRWGQR